MVAVKSWYWNACGSKWNIDVTVTLNDNPLFRLRIQWKRLFSQDTILLRGGLHLQLKTQGNILFVLVLTPHGGLAATDWYVN